MRFITILRLAAVGAVLGFLALATPAQDQSGDDVAAAARKAREKQKQETKPAKVFTNDDFPSVPTPPPPAAAAGTKTEGTPETAAPTGEEKQTSGPEAVWKKRFRVLRDKLSQQEKELEVLQQELNNTQVQYYSDPQKAMQQQYDRSDINEKTAKIDKKKQEIADTKQQLSDLEDELRKSGGDPGWAR